MDFYEAAPFTVAQISVPWHDELSILGRALPDDDATRTTTAWNGTTGSKPERSTQPALPLLVTDRAVIDPQPLTPGRTARLGVQPGSAAILPEESMKSEVSRARIAALTLSAIYLYAWPAPNLVLRGGGAVPCRAGGCVLRCRILAAPRLRRTITGGEDWRCAVRRRFSHWAGPYLHRNRATSLNLRLRPHCGMRCGSRHPAQRTDWPNASERNLRTWDSAACGARRRGLVSAGAWYARSARGASSTSSRTLQRAAFHGLRRRRRARRVLPQLGAGRGETKIPAKYFMESDACARCHQDIYKQWQSSAHHFSSFNNQWYRKSIEYMQDVTVCSHRSGVRDVTIRRCCTAA